MNNYLALIFVLLKIYFAKNEVQRAQNNRGKNTIKKDNENKIIVL